MKIKLKPASVFVVCGWLLLLAICMTAESPETQAGGGTSRTYYVDSAAGNDANAGTRANAPWRTLDKVNAATFQPGDRSSGPRAPARRPSRSSSTGTAKGPSRPFTARVCTKRR